MGQICTLGFGKANLSNTLATYSCMKVTGPWLQVSAVTSGKRHGMNQAAPVGVHEMSGSLITGRSEHENDTIIKVQASWKTMQVPVRDAALFFKLRAGAPLYRVDARVPTGPENHFGDLFTIFSAYGDLMNSEDLYEAGIALPRQYADKFMQEDEVEECFVLTQVQPETMARPIKTAILSASGVQYEEMAQRPQRRIRLRRP